MSAPPVVEAPETLAGRDLADLCEAAEAAILDGGGFGWLHPPPRQVLERFWTGVLLVPERKLFVARMDGTIVGSAQLIRPPRNNEAQAFVATMTTVFVAPWARGNGIGASLTAAVEKAAREEGFLVLGLDVRETQTTAIRHYESVGFVRWGTNPTYAIAGGRMIAGHYYAKRLRPLPPPLTAGEAEKGPGAR